jgi:hypothetical protein
VARSRAPGVDRTARRRRRRTPLFTARQPWRSRICRRRRRFAWRRPRTARRGHGAATAGDNDAAAELIGAHVDPADPPEVASAKVGAASIWCDPEPRLGIADIERQIAWYQAEGLVDAGVSAAAIVDTSSTEEPAGAGRWTSSSSG